MRIGYSHAISHCLPSRKNTPQSATRNQAASFVAPSNAQDLFFKGNGNKQSSHSNEDAESSSFNSVEESFFIRPRYERNPFAEKSDELENNPVYRRQAKAYETRLDHSTSAKITKVAVNSTLGYGLLQLINITDSPVLGIVAGCTTGLYAEPVSRGIVKLWEVPPPLVQKKEALDQLDSEICSGKLVRTLSNEWPKHTQGDEKKPLQLTLSTLPFIGKNSEPEEPATLLGTALISRYPEHQEALKSSLPGIRGKYHTRKIILPALEKAISNSEYQSCQATLSPALEKGIQDMLHYGEMEQRYLDTPFRNREENQRYERHLLQKLPDIVEYLEQD